MLLHKERMIGIGGPKLVELGPIMDISLGGLAVQYMENKKRAVDATQLSISIPSEGIALSGLAFRVVSDKALAQLPDGQLIRKRCVQFVNLKPHQRFQLESFINHFSISLKEDRRIVIDRRENKDPEIGDQDYYRMHSRRSNTDRRNIMTFAK